MLIRALAFFISICKTQEREKRGAAQVVVSTFVSLFVSVSYVCICLCIYLCVCVCICVCICLCIFLCICLCIYLCIFLCICVCICKPHGLVYGGRHLWFSDRGVSLRAAESNLSRDAQIQFIFILCQPPSPPSYNLYNLSFMIQPSLSSSSLYQHSFTMIYCWPSRDEILGCPWINSS